MGFSALLISLIKTIQLLQCTYPPIKEQLSFSCKLAAYWGLSLKASDLTHVLERTYHIGDKRVIHCCVFTLRYWVNIETKLNSGMMVWLVLFDWMGVFYSASHSIPPFIYLYNCLD